ncbi:thiol-disulfide oxidoreductase DCC family protein [Salinispirillum marinum]|uniref:Thiol-disulfide oxidoreductase DCC family protein n=2 Tax=Saccharospirillaceae TaxID=255527 RepID=A0ABV8BB91_9GAMM
MPSQPLLPELYYDKRCGLCRAEIHHLAPRFRNKMILVDISAPNFTGAHGVEPLAMLQRIHVWDGERFHIGLDGTLFYWRVAGFGWLTAILSWRWIKPVAAWSYDTWAQRRAIRKGYCAVEKVS